MWFKIRFAKIAKSAKLNHVQKKHPEMRAIYCAGAGFHFFVLGIKLNW